MKPGYAITLLLIGLTSPVISQRIEFIGDERYTGNFIPVQRTLNYSEIQGSPYLDDDLIKGYVKFSLGDTSVQFLRYNIYTDQMEYLSGDKLLVIENTNEVDQVFVNNHSFYYTTYKYRNAFKKGYLEQLVSGYYELYIKYDVDFEKRQEAQSSYEKPTPDRFVQKLPTWYCAIDNRPIMDFVADKSGLEALFKEDYSEIKKYIKSEKLKLRKKEDMTQLFEYYNSLK